MIRFIVIFFAWLAFAIAPAVAAPPNWSSGVYSGHVPASAPTLGYCGGDDSTIPVAASSGQVFKMAASSASWTQTNVLAITANTTETTDPFGTHTAFKIEMDDIGSGGEHSAVTPITSSPGVVATYLCLKAKSGTQYIAVYQKTAGGEYYVVLFDATNPASPGTDITESDAACNNFGDGSDCAYKITAEGNGWFRVIIYRTMSVGAGAETTGAATFNAAILAAYPYLGYYTGGPDFNIYLVP